MTKIILSVIMLIFLSGCIDRIEGYHIRNAIKICGSAEDIYYVATGFGAYVKCSDGRFLKNNNENNSN